MGDITSGFREDDFFEFVILLIERKDGVTGEIIGDFNNRDGVAMDVAFILDGGGKSDARVE